MKSLDQSVHTSSFRLFFPDSFSDIIDEYDEVSRYVVYAYSSTSILMNNIIPVPGV